MSQRPNILWICTDQQRYDTIHALGNHRIKTPHTDRLIRDGVAFTRAYCQSPVCTPSRASFLTGRYARTTRCRQNGQQIPKEEKLLSRIFADHDYTCGLAGKLHLSSCAKGRVESRIDDGYKVFDWSHHPQPDWPENAYSQWLGSKGQSWDKLYQGASTSYIKEGVPSEYHQTTWCAEKTIEFIQSHSEEPWFFSFNCFDPHHPFDPPPEYMSLYDPDQMELPKFKHEEWNQKSSYQKLDHRWAHNEPGYFDLQSMTDDDRRQITAAYYAMVTLIDDQLGRIIAALEQSGQLEKTLLVFMSDHGEMLGDHGLYLKGPHFYEEALRVPLVLHWPEGFESGIQCDGLVELIDLAPTFCEAANIPVYEGFQGKSLTNICRGESSPDQHRDFVFSEYYNAWTHRHSYGTMLRSKTEKIVAYHGTDDGEIYDLEKDPNEFENLWNRPGEQDRKMRLLKWCFDTSVFTMDPMPPRLGPF
ncbi:MAG: sulfatase-like hydrolase/transferase [Verrucomicrobia bacterium]|nr:sulfatase-like hydrolase/transferase [Verrucomicrobiota bacterium]MBT4273510.1 sulfatase-like hydrolase/transferase [Verrucomicrobiota bacterium]MBT5061725.1 sulfatase-like hydrolase/transferase [Verrucomicrobiota bacterium]MBT6237536.1 sulfatase-like hydrolase/transferase [Verrucomicrobiota bacterium]MBT7536691.1 sulfatase-like hydrolase/transferase [Verrucomicrobiota bacterium]